MTNPKKTITAAAAALLLTGAFAIGAPAASRSADEVPGPVKTLFQKRCAGCHKGKFPPKGLSLKPASLAAIIDAPSQDPDKKPARERVAEFWEIYGQFNSAAAAVQTAASLHLGG
ncbi:MAG: hypothetical protein HGA24_08435 [Candidatus Aminicenantes bacterium]|nr:hypothetical protein [Candidatus Aminicenantes bacterium]